MSKWIPWSGGRCPVNENEVVQIQFSDGSVNPVPVRAGRLDWSHTGHTGDITAYRTVAEYLFDVPMFAAVRIRAISRAEAEATIRDYFDAASCKADGFWPDGSPIKFEASVDGEVDLVEVDGEPV